MKFFPAAPHSVLNRDTVKYIAMATMLLNHIATIFMESGQFWSKVFLDIGYFTASVMCFFLVEGFQYTHSKKRYATRLALFALLSELPYCLAFTQSGILEFCGMNMIFTLLLCFLILLALDQLKNAGLKTAAVILCIGISLFSDWALLAPIFTLLFVWAKGSRKKAGVAFLLAMVLFGFINFIGGLGRFSWETNLIYTLGSMTGVFLAGLTIVFLYNGQRSHRAKIFSKWFFYWFYPVHLLILGILRIALF